MSEIGRILRVFLHNDFSNYLIPKLFEHFVHPLGVNADFLDRVADVAGVDYLFHDDLFVSCVHVEI